MAPPINEKSNEEHLELYHIGIQHAADSQRELFISQRAYEEVIEMRVIIGSVVVWFFARMLGKG